MPMAARRTLCAISTGRVAPMPNVGGRKSRKHRPAPRPRSSGAKAGPAYASKAGLMRPNRPMPISMAQNSPRPERGQRSASQPPSHAPRPRPAMKTETIRVTDSRSAPTTATSRRCQALW